MMRRPVTKITTNFIEELDEIIETLCPDRVFVLTDNSAKKYCLPVLSTSKWLQNASVITIAQGDEHKNIASAVEIWTFLTKNDATRRSLMINLGGGVISDTGGFVAATFKRGIRYVNLSTTLLGAVDAATGGKTGVNFLGYKNEIGVFSPAEAVLVNTDFFHTLDAENLRSGFAEIVKHALIHSLEEWNGALAFDLDNVDFEKLKEILARSIRIKERIVEQDPKELHLRKALNAGHTVGHAIESWSYGLNRPVLHGYAVVWGLICELYLSFVQTGFPKNELLKFGRWAKEYYGECEIDCKHYDMLYELMRHDKKNEGDCINFTLLKRVGEPVVDRTASKKEIFESFDYLRDGW
jgi:3-dehydroquinate synthase